MVKYENNSATQLVEDALWEFDPNVPPKDAMEEMNSVTTFFDYVHRYAARCGYTGDAADAGALALFVSDLCKEAGITLGSDTKNTLT